MLERMDESPGSKRHIYKTSQLGQEFIGKYKEVARLFNKLPPTELV
jgi:hypothetical protein